MEGLKSFELHHYYRSLDYLVEHKEAIEKRVFQTMSSLFQRKVDVVLFDPPSLVYYGDSEKHEDLLNYGFSKARRGDLKQIVVEVGFVTNLRKHVDMPK